jgi:hypothetical protein
VIFEGSPAILKETWFKPKDWILNFARAENVDSRAPKLSGFILEG